LEPIQPPAAFVVEWSQALDIALAGVVELRGVLQTQHPRVRAQALDGAGHVRGEHRLGADRGMIKQPVGRTGFAPTTTRARDTQRRFLPQALQHPPRATIQTHVTQIDVRQLRHQRAHAATPKMPRKSARSG
jgi:hypothetical protein